MSIRAGLLVEKLDGQTEITDDTGVVVANEDVLALEVSVSDGRLLRDAVDDPLVVEVSQALIDG